MSPDLEKRLSEFIDCPDTDSCIYEMYVDKAYPNKTIVSLKRRHRSLIQDKDLEPLLYFTFKNRKIFLITGIESVFKAEKKKDIYKGYSDDYGCYKVMAITYEADSVEVDTNAIFPFFPLSKIKFLPPVKKSNKK